MTYSEKIQLILDYEVEFVRFGHVYFSRPSVDCESLFKQKKHLFEEQLRQDLEADEVKTMFYTLTKTIYIAHIREIRDGWKWQIKIEPIKPKEIES